MPAPFAVRRLRVDLLRLEGPALAPPGVILMTTIRLSLPDRASRSLALAFACSALVALPASAQRTARTIGKDVWSAGSDVVAVWMSPVRASGRDWVVAGGVVAMGAAISPLDDDADRWAVRHSDGGFGRALEPIRESRGTNLGDLPTGRILLPASGALYLAGFLADKPGLRDAAMGCVASQQANSAVRHATYALVSRTRPSEFSDDAVPLRTAQGDQYEIAVPGGEWEEHSFFGGHVANAFACATFFSERFELGMAEPLLYAFATGIGVARTMDRRHWVSDNVLGAAFGYAVGRTVARRSKERARQRDAAERGAAAPSPVEPRLGRALMEVGTSRTRVGWEVSF